MQAFKAFRIHLENKKIVARFEQLQLDDLNPGEVVVRVQYSDINYKDALAATGAGRILRKYPLVGGIDLAGVVESSSDARFKAGDGVLVTGCGLSETRDGGYAEFARLEAESVVPLPAGIDARQAMALGTAGFTAALAINRMEHNGQTPERGAVVVTGATGGVGSIAVDMLAGRGYEVVAVTGKPDSADYLKSLGASRILLRSEINYGSKPLEAAQFAGAIDNVGGEMLTWLTRTMDSWGNIASIGLAGSPELHTTVMPFILRGVNILGINSSATRRPERLRVWERIAGDCRPRHLDRIVTRTLPFADLPGVFDEYIQGTVTGRTVVKIV
ncbi:MAG TPA: oxidoreductase [Steroidobacteraceae bacterium]|nr:oxidoreductase [Steroidobacteraceae bacterium]HRX87888.1 oxidoreductase [Steroidobacteraceae bacterium]